jgi:hypothetical protein
VNNATLLTADRTTHVKIVLIALVASTAVSLVGIGGHVRPVGPEPVLRTTTSVVMAGTSYIANPNHSNLDHSSRD